MNRDPLTRYLWDINDCERQLHQQINYDFNNFKHLNIITDEMLEKMMVTHEYTEKQINLYGRASGISNVQSFTYNSDIYEKDPHRDTMSIKVSPEEYLIYRRTLFQKALIELKGK